MMVKHSGFERGLRATETKRSRSAIYKLLRVFVLIALFSCTRACEPGPEDPTCCPAGYVWSSATSTCEIDDPESIVLGTVNCATVPYAAGQNGANACFCVSGFIWNVTSLQCEYNCSSVFFSTGKLLNGSQVDCECVHTMYVWTFATHTCTVNCSAVPNSANGSTLSNNTCICLSGYSFVSSTNYSVCQWNCSLIAHTEGATTTSGICVCATPYSWNPAGLFC